MSNFGHAAQDIGVTSEGVSKNLQEAVDAGDFSGDTLPDAIYQKGNAPATTYNFGIQRYIIDAPPSEVGKVVKIDKNIMNELCEDKDGCYVTVSMINWDANQDNNIASRTFQLFLSETSKWWRGSTDTAGRDDDAVTNEFSPWDCYFTDAEESTNTNNGRKDDAEGWGLLNCKGCSYSDTLVTCRVILQD